MTNELFTHRFEALIKDVRMDPHLRRQFIDSFSSECEESPENGFQKIVGWTIDTVTRWNTDPENGRMFPEVATAMHQVMLKASEEALRETDSIIDRREGGAADATVKDFPRGSKR